MPRTSFAEYELEYLENASGRAFRLYLAARSERRPPGQIAALWATYESTLAQCRRARTPPARGSFRRTAA